MEMRVTINRKHFSDNTLRGACAALIATTVLNGLIARSGVCYSWRPTIPAEWIHNWGFIDRTGKFVIKPQFNDAGPFRNGLAWVGVGDDKFRMACNYID